MPNASPLRLTRECGDRLPPAAKSPTPQRSHAKQVEEAKLAAGEADPVTRRVLDHAERAGLFLTCGEISKRIKRLAAATEARARRERLLMLARAA